MCGICGKFVFAGSERLTTYQEMARMCQVMIHRGPDSQGIKLWDRKIGLGMRRLSIIDLSSGDQPISNEDGTVWIVFNGEIYNYQELRTELLQAGHVFKTKSDTEVLIHLYEEYGDSFIERCNGMFALCIYDVRRQRLYLARDRVGKKPLYYHINRDYFVFGSELKCLFVNETAPRRVKRSAILEFLTFGFINAPDTAFEEIYQLEPAHYMIVEGDRIHKQRYWIPDYAHMVRRSLEEAREHYLELLSTCVRDRLISDVPVGLLLSGGIDSCSIAAMMAEQDVSIPTFTIRFKNAEKDEGNVAALVARRLRTEHEELYVEMGDVINILPLLVWHYEQPFGDSSAIPTYYVAQMASQRVTVVLNGDGGDECFGGYWRHLFNVWLHRLRWIPNFAWRLVEQTGNRLSEKVGYSPVLRWLVWSSQTAQKKNEFDASWSFLAGIADQARQLLDPMFADSNHSVFSPLRAAWDECASAPYLNRLLYSCDLRFCLPGVLLVKMDRATMANSLEARSPFLDYRMIEFAASLPPSWKVRGLTTKWFPRFAMRGHLPQSVLQKRKAGFDIPIRAWMTGKLGDLAWEVILSEQAQSRGYFDIEALTGLYKASRAGKVDCSHLLYQLLFLELWHRAFIDGFSTSPDLSILDKSSVRVESIAG